MASVKRLNALRRVRAQIVKTMIEQGWNPPPPSDRVMDRILDDLRNPPPNAKLDLAARERACLTLAACGMNRAEMAQALGISSEMVKDYLDRARRRLGARNTANAVAIALRNNAIDLPAESKREVAA